MSIELRVILLLAAIITAVWILWKIRKHKVKLEDAIFWIVFAVILLILGLFPQIAHFLKESLGMVSTANLIFLVMIFLLLVKVFTLSIKVSQLQSKLEILASELAIRTGDGKCSAGMTLSEGASDEKSGGYGD